MKCRNLKLFSLALSSVLSISALSGCGESEIKNYNSSQYTEEVGSTVTKEFAPGEHYVSIPMSEDITKEVTEITSPPGYEVMSVSHSSFGQTTDRFAGGTILYVNTEPVLCETNLYSEDGEVPFLYFGTPVNQDNTKTNNDYIREFGIGEHVLLVPFTEDATMYNNQYFYHEGYEIIGISVSAYGKTTDRFATGLVIYKNNVPVNVSKSENGYVSFGTPVEEVKELTK